MKKQSLFNRAVKIAAVSMLTFCLFFNGLLTLEFDGSNYLPSIFISSQEALASDNDCGNLIWGCEALWQRLESNDPCQKEICLGFMGFVQECNTFNGVTEYCIDGPDWSCHSFENCLVVPT